MKSYNNRETAALWIPTAEAQLEVEDWIYITINVTEKNEKKQNRATEQK